jgi:PIN domain nuclease of toxin-antitoxin system
MPNLYLVYLGGRTPKSNIAYLSRSLQFDHADPIDRFIAATAFQLNIPLVTADASLQKLSWLKVVS